jgi:hypothetical protein
MNSVQFSGSLRKCKFTIIKSQYFFFSSRGFLLFIFSGWRKRAFSAGGSQRFLKDLAALSLLVVSLKVSVNAFRWMEWVGDPPPGFDFHRAAPAVFVSPCVFEWLQVVRFVRIYFRGPAQPEIPSQWIVPAR